MLGSVVALDGELPTGNLTRANAAQMLYEAAMLKNQEEQTLI